MPFGIPPRQNPPPDTIPDTSLVGTMTTPSYPQPGIAPPAGAGMMLPKAAFQAMPQDYQSLLTSPSLSPAFETPASEEPHGGQKALDYILNALGGFLGGGAPGLLQGIQVTRENMRQIREEQRIAAQESAKSKMDFITKGLEQGRKDKLGEAEEKLRQAKQAGDQQAIDLAKQDIENAKSTHAAQMDRDAAELAASRAELDRAAARLDRKDDPDHQTGLAMIGNYNSMLDDYRTQLNTQLTSGAGGEPILRKKIGDAVYEIAGVENIRQELENGLEQAVEQSAALGDPEIQERLRTAYSIALEPILERWTERTTINRVERAKKSREKARQGARAFKRGQDDQGRGKAIGASMGGSGIPPLPN